MAGVTIAFSKAESEPGFKLLLAHQQSGQEERKR